VLFGIGITLLVERNKDVLGFRGLSMGGAVCIHLWGSAALMVWLLGGQLDIPQRDYKFLWILSEVVLE
jgi:hypothetical protein